MNKEYQERINSIEVPKTSHLLLLESVAHMGSAIKAIPNPQTWNIEALIFAIHLHDCKLCFEDMLSRWKVALPFDEAADVDFTEWRNRVWDAVVDARPSNTNVSTDDNAKKPQELCDDDYAKFFTLSREHLNGNVPLQDLLVFLSEKHADLAQLIRTVGEQLSCVLADIDEALTQADCQLYEDIYHKIANEYKGSKWADVRRDEYDHWKARISSRTLMNKLNDKIKTHINTCSKSKNWAEVWSENFIEESQTIDIEGVGRKLIEHRNELRSNKYRIAELEKSHLDVSELKDTDELMRMILLHELLHSERELLIMHQGEAAVRGNIAPQDQAYAKFTAMYMRVIDDLHNRWNGKQINLGGANGVAIVAFDKERVKQLLSDIIVDDKEVVQLYAYRGTQFFTDNDFCEIFSTLRKHPKKPFGELTGSLMAETIANDIEINNKPSSIKVHISSHNADESELGQKLIERINRWR